MAARTDVLIVTALQDELDALLGLGARGKGAWEKAREPSGFRYYLRAIDRASGPALRVAAAWIGEMGERAAAIRVQQLLHELDPSCLAMCGICAGKRGEVVLGDVIIGDRLYSYDHGKLIADEAGQVIEFRHDIETYSLEKAWKMDAAFLARELNLRVLEEERPPSKEAQRAWLLEALYAHQEEGGPAPQAHPARKARCPGWTELLKGLRKEGLVEVSGGGLALTALGREQALEARLLFPDGLPPDPALRVHVGAIATGKAVREDPGLFDRLRRIVRSTLGAEMEGVALGDLGERFQKRVIVVKAVADHADGEKDDSFRAFACHASAIVLLAFLQKHLAKEEVADPHQLPPRTPAPSYTDARGRVLSEQLEAAYARKQSLVQGGFNTVEVDRRILGLRRELREGGQLQEGDSLGDGRYLLLKRLGKGGFAIVWEAYDKERCERVAVKVLHADLARDPARCERFFRGARAMAELDHEGVVRIRERHGEDAGWRYFIMDFVPGGDVRQAVLHKKLSGEEMLAIVLRVGAALGAAHAKGLIHRDVKPANILLEDGGAPKLTDFDLVAAADTTGGTRTGALGTFLYAAPESMHRPQDVDARADVYGLGMTAVFGLFGAELPMEVVRDAGRFVERLACGEAVKTALKRAVEWDLEARFPSVGVLCEALRAASAPMVSESPLERVRNEEEPAVTERKPGELLEAAQRDVASSSFRLSGSDLSQAPVEGARPRVAEHVGSEVEPLSREQAQGLVAAGEVRPELMWTVASPCNAVAWSPLGALIASGHDNGSIQLWDLVTGKALRALHAHVGSVFSLAFSPDGALLASGAQDRTVRLWQVAAGRMEQILQGHAGPVCSVTFSPDSAQLASASYDATVRLWQVATGRLARTLEGHTNEVRCVAFSPDGTRLASASRDTMVLLWRVATGEVEQTLQGHTGPVVSVAFTPDGTQLESASTDRTVRLWGAATGETEQTLQSHTAIVSSVVFDPGGMRYAWCGHDGTVWVCQLATGRAEPLAGHTKRVEVVAFSKDGTRLASASADTTVRLWQVATGRAEQVLRSDIALVRSVAFSPDGNRLASASYDRTVRLWGVRTSRLEQTLVDHGGLVTTVAFSPDGARLASGSSDRTVRLWELTTGRTAQMLRGHTDRVTVVAYSPDGAWLASGSYDKAVRLCELKDGRVQMTLQGHSGPVRTMAFSPNGRRLASGSYDRTIRLWEVGTSRQEQTLRGHTDEVRSVAFSPNGLRLASGSYDKTVRLWEIETGQEIQTLEGHNREVLSVAFSPDGWWLASGSSDTTVLLWQEWTGRVERILRGHTAPVCSVAFNPDSTLLASASHDGTVRLWSVTTGACLAILLAASNGWVAFTPDGRYKLGGDIAGSFWHVVGLHRFELGELDPYLKHPLRIPDDEPLFAPHQLTAQ